MMPGERIKSFSFTDKDTDKQDTEIWSKLQKEAKSSGYAGLDLEGFKMIMTRVKF
jgi:hypothetical protein